MELAVLRVLAAFGISFTLFYLRHIVKFFCDKT
jgi:hypothetical protein